MKTNSHYVNIDMEEFPVILKEFMEFITRDEMEGIKDLEFMLKDEELSKRVPADVKKEFEQITSTISSRIETALTKFIKELEVSRSKSKEQALDLIQAVLDTITENEGDDIPSTLCVIIPKAEN